MSLHNRAFKRKRSIHFIVNALMLGLLSQPRGPLVLPRKSTDINIWRFSPLLCTLEVFVVIFYIVHEIIKKIPHRDVVYMLMLKRIDASMPKSN